MAQLQKAPGAILLFYTGDRSGLLYLVLMCTKLLQVFARKFVVSLSNRYQEKSSRRFFVKGEYPSTFMVLPSTEKRLKNF